MRTIWKWIIGILVFLIFCGIGVWFVLRKPTQDIYVNTSTTEIVTTVITKDVTTTLPAITEVKLVPTTVTTTRLYPYDVTTTVTTTEPRYITTTQPFYVVTTQVVTQVVTTTIPVTTTITPSPVTSTVTVTVCPTRKGGCDGK